LKTYFERKVSREEALKLVEKEGLHFYEVSAKTNENILTMFYSSIVELPFFEQFEVQNKQQLIEQLGKIE
jgi:hypothetical protein